MKHLRQRPARQRILAIYNSGTGRTDVLLTNEAGVVTLIDSVDPYEAQDSIDAVRRDFPQLPVDVRFGAIRSRTTTEEQE